MDRRFGARRDGLDLAETPLAIDFMAGAHDDTTFDRKVLLKGGTILSMDAAIGDFVTGDVLVEGRRIAAVRPEIDATANVIDASGMIVMPGLVDAHRHLWANAFRRLLANADGAGYSRFANSLIPYLREEDVFIASALGGWSAIHSGITSMLDYSHIAKASAICDAAVLGHQSSGIRAVYAYAAPRTGPSNPAYPGDLERLIQRFFTSEDQLLSLRLGTRMDSANYALARRFGLGITSDGIFGIATPLRPESSASRILDMARAAELGDDVTLIHGTGLADDVMKAIADSGVCVVLAPTSDTTLRGLGNSVPPIQGVLDHDLLHRTGISVDIEVALCSDLFAQMRAIFTVQRVLANLRWSAADTRAPKPIKVRDVLTMATIGGARASGLDKKVGSLTPGKEADIIMVSADTINTGPLNNAAGTVVIGAGSEDVDTVFIRGRLKKWRGQLVGVDVEAVMRTAKQSRDRLAQASGLWQPADIVT